MKVMKKLLSVVLIAACVLPSGCLSTKKEKKYDFADTEWRSDDDSYMTISKKMKFAWYQNEDDQDDNYHKGKIEIYQGTEAFNYITEDLEEFGVTKKELNQLMKNNKEYSKENLVVFYIEHDSYVLNGEELIDEVQRTDDYWFGWILEDGEFLDMCNMNTGMYYPFEKV